MNDALRLLRKFLRGYGYDIKRYHQYNLLPIANLSEFSSLSRLHQAEPTPGATAAELGRLCICLRTCLRRDEQARHAPAFAGANRAEMVFRCVQSLVNSINHAIAHHLDVTIELRVLDDHSDEAVVAQLKELCQKSACAWLLKTTRARGQGASLLEQFEYARGQDALFYFCEDDYLHEPSALLEMCRFYRQVYKICGTHLLIHPQEHEFLYTRHIYPSYLLLGEHRHWRTISHATHTLFLHSATVKKYWDCFANTQYVGDRKRRRLGVESRTTNLLFEQMPGFAPIPALAAHMQAEGCLPPFFDWRNLWERSNPGQ